MIYFRRNRNELKLYSSILYTHRHAFFKKQAGYQLGPIDRRRMFSSSVERGGTSLLNHLIGQNETTKEGKGKEKKEEGRGDSGTRNAEESDELLRLPRSPRTSTSKQKSLIQTIRHSPWRHWDCTGYTGYIYITFTTLCPTYSITTIRMGGAVSIENNKPELLTLRRSRHSGDTISSLGIEEEEDEAMFLTHIPFKNRPPYMITVNLISSPSAFELHLPSTTFFCRIGSESLDFLSPQFEILMQFPFHLLVTWGACSSSVFQFQVIPKGGLVVESSSVGSTLQINLQCSEPILLSKALDASTALFIAETEAMCLEVPSILLLKSDLTTSDGQIDREFTDIIRYHCDQSRRSFSIKQGTLLF